MSKKKQVVRPEDDYPIEDELVEPETAPVLARLTTRRGFLGGTLVGGVGLVAIAAVGCGDDDDDDDDDDSVEATEPPATAEGTGEATGTEPEGTPEPFDYVDSGISDTEIKIGNSLPYSGPGAPFGAQGAGYKAYFAYVNEEQGGVDGRQINFITYDDAYDPAQTVENVRRLVEQDEVFALCGVLGTPQNQAILDYVNQSEVPNLLIGTFARSFEDPEVAPWSVMGGASYYDQGRILGAYVGQEFPGAKVAIFKQNDDLGGDWADGFKEGLGDAGEVVGEETYEPADAVFDQQVISLRDSGADVWFNASVPRPGVLSITKAFDIGWEPQLVMVGNNAVKQVWEAIGPARVEGAIRTGGTKDPADPAYEDDPDMVFYKETMAKYEPDADVNDALVMLGFSSAKTLVEAILARMEEPSRAGLMAAARSIEGYATGYSIEGIELTARPETNYLGSQSAVEVFNGVDRFEQVGEIIDSADL